MFLSCIPQVYLSYRYVKCARGGATTDITMCKGWCIVPVSHYADWNEAFLRNPIQREGRGPERFQSLDAWDNDYELTRQPTRAAASSAQALWTPTWRSNTYSICTSPTGSSLLCWTINHSILAALECEQLVIRP